jgi:hypothetical protein
MATETTKAAGNSRGLMKQIKRGLLARAPVTGSTEPSQSDDCDDVAGLWLIIHGHFVAHVVWPVNSA